MPRRRRSKISPAFFPFISVLISIIGVLIFLTLSITLTALDPPLIIESAEKATEEEGKPGVAGVSFYRRMVMIELKNDTAFVAEREGKEIRMGQQFDVNNEWARVIEIYRELGEDDPGKWQGSPFLDFLNELAADRKRPYLLFLIRPSGIHPFSVLSDIVQRRNSAKGVEETEGEPLKGWKVDWTLTYQPEDRKVIPRSR